MTKQEFRALCDSRILYLDGATGSYLMSRGMPSGVCPEAWILEHPDIFVNMQKDYIAAGSDIVYAPTFTANRIKLSEYGLEDRIEEINTELVRLSRTAGSGTNTLIAGDITMCGRQLKPYGPMDFEELVDVYKEQISILEKAGVDLLVVETMMSLQETRAAMIAAKEVCDLPVMVTMTFEGDERTLFGTDAKSAAIVIESLGADAMGANCSVWPYRMVKILKDMASVSTIPLIAKPNAGLPQVDSEGRTFYDMDSDLFGGFALQLYEAGACILGGCCGTSPEFIKAVRACTEGLVPKKRSTEGRRFLASERMSLEFGLDGSFMIVGERINPTGKKALQAQLREKNFELVLRFAEEQEACGASILDINMGMSGIDEKDMMLEALQEVAGVSSLPISIDSSHVEVIEAALRRYPGRALINSVSNESHKRDRLLELARKYGAMFVLLPLSDTGLPRDIDEKKAWIDEVAARAFEFGLKKEDIIVDGLVATVGANKRAALETLETIGYCRREGYATVCGLSNISFGLPERSYINTAFLTMAIGAGLTMAIANPSQELLTGCMLATDLLLCKESADLRYIEEMNLRKESGADSSANSLSFGTERLKAKKQNAEPKTDASEQSAGRKVYEAVVKGNQRAVKDLTAQAVDDGIEPSELLQKYLLPAINEVGDLFDKGKYFLPQLIAGAEAMKISIEYLEPFLVKEGDGSELPVIVIATVKGDIHDIGKNLVALMLKNYGFRVIDLGKDVPREEIIEAARENNASVIALSALMTTTMQEMKHVIEYAKEQGITAKIVIGGAVITQDYADEIGADGYSKDAQEAVKLSKRLLNMEDGN